MFKAMLIAGFGGFIGTCLRFLTGKLCRTLCDSAFPWGTFTVNVAGSFIIGILFGLAERNNVISPSMNALLITGFCGGFTTFSSLADDMFVLLQQRHWMLFGIYVAASFALGLLMVWAGRSIVRA
ncbi:MAG: fluoride efflux transporter CrcB [Alistipes sp.]|nr:fluoride efflux transporter CrcB [Alistipes sp.]